MPGAWITAVARHLLDEETFDLVVSPAIADLQFESATVRGAERVRGYLAVLVACLGAAGHDLLVDSALLHDDAPTLIRVVLMQVAYYSSMLTIRSCTHRTRSTPALHVRRTLGRVCSTLA